MTDPTHEPEPDLAPPPRHYHPPPRLTAIAAVTFLALGALVDAAAVASGAWQTVLYTAVVDGRAVSDDTWFLVDLADLVIWLATTATYLASIIAFCLWFYRAVRFARAYDTDYDVPSPGWAVGSFFVPIANFFVPFKAAAAAWRVTFSALDNARPAARLVICWWFTWIIGGLISQYFLRSTLKDSLAGIVPTPEEYLRQLQEYMIADTIAILAALLAIAMITRLTNAQRRLARAPTAAADPA